MTRILHKALAIIDFFFFYLKEMILANLKVALDILTPRHLMHPAFLKLNVADLTPRQLVVANNLITMTPGTLCADYDDTRKELTIHAMYVDDIQEEEALIRNTIIKKIKNVF